MVNIEKLLLLFLAPFTTFVSAAIVVSNAVTPGATLTDNALRSLPPLITCFGAHLLPSMSKHIVVRLMWVACLIVTMYIQQSYFTNNSTVEGERRAKNSVQVASLKQRIETIKEEHSRIHARPVAVVARALSKATDEKIIAALNAEMEEAKRAERLQDTLITLQGNMVSIQIAESNDPEISLLVSVTGISAAVISFCYQTTRTLMMELLGAFFWYKLQSKPHQEVKPEISVASVSLELPVPEVPVSPDDDKLAIVRQAVENGEIKQTVASIRKFLKCSTAKAMAIRKAFLSIPNHSPVARGEAKLDYIHPVQSEKSRTDAQLKKAA